MILVVFPFKLIYINVITMNLKICKICALEKPLTEYQMNKAREAFIANLVYIAR